MKLSKPIIFVAIALSSVVAFSVVSRAPAIDADYTLEQKPEIIAATFSSALCSACKVLEPKLAEIMPSFSDRPVRFLKLNFSFGQSDQPAAMARAYSFEDAYDRFHGATGFTLLIDADTGDVINVLTMNHSKKLMKLMIAQSIAIAERDDVESDQTATP